MLPQLLGGGNGYDDAGSNDDDGDEDDHMIVVMVAMTRYLHQGFLIRTPGHDGGGITLKDNDGDGDDRGNGGNDKQASGDCHSYNHESFQCPPK